MERISDSLERVIRIKPVEAQGYCKKHCTTFTEVMPGEYCCDLCFEEANQKCDVCPAQAFNRYRNEYTGQMMCMNCAEEYRNGDYHG